MEFISQPTSLTFLAFLADQASKVIACHDAATYSNNNNNNASSSSSSSSSSRSRSSGSSSSLPALTEFVDFIVHRSSVGPGTLLAALVLLDRLRHRLAPVAKKGMPCTCQRIFLATLVVTSKLLNDTAPRNGHWMQYAYYFTVAEINLMEKQLLALLVCPSGLTAALQTS
ncbi:hypothetical protein BX666DRAFT_1868253 [Dichotomocladium elegans]|nr:hypothetical protein BX666DRAFT_1868253 [Dichotomocladium elegans]